MLALKKEAILICCVALTLLGCATNGEYRRQALEAYYQALQATEPQKNEILQPGSEKERAAIERFTFLLAHFTEDNIRRYIRDVYAPNAYYRDSVTAKQGVENIETYYIEGARTMHELAFDLQDCEDRLRLVAFKIENARGEGDYFDGLAATLPFACAAADTLDEPLGSASEGLTAAALGWLGTGACASIIPTATARAKPAVAAATGRYPLPQQPSPAQLWLPGVT